MSHTIVTYTVRPGRKHENAALVRAVFEELAKTRPAGFRYAIFKLSDSPRRASWADWQRSATGRW